MDSFRTLVDSEKLEQLNRKIYERAHVDREHLMEFLTLIPTNDGDHIILEVKYWLKTLHNDPLYDKVVFPPGHIDAVITDLASYGRVHPMTVLKYKEKLATEAPTP